MSGAVTVCRIPDELKATLKKFRYSKSTTTNALILKIDKEKMELIVADNLEDCQVSDIRNELPSSQPRFLVISYEVKHNDGRISYPLCLIFYSPPGSSPETQILYAGSVNNLVAECQLAKSATVRDIDEITDEFLMEKFA